jgi:phosphopantothenoylcysteine decarboxylase/phosphopantothenate--cysteine ligase
MIKGKKILLGVTGSIAAYKSAELVRLLVKLGAEVRVVLTPSALSFVTPLTLATLSKNPVHHAYVEDETTGVWTNHVELGKWADLFLIAPLSANTLSKLVTGVCDNLLIASYLSASCKIMVAPAMDLDMADHWTTSKNLQQLTERNAIVLPFGIGELASGLEGKGRMLEPHLIAEAVLDYFIPNGFWKAKRVVVTAGPTYEAIDPVRFIGNHSSGKMGFAIAEELAKQGAHVTLVSGPTALPSPQGVKVDRVVSAEDMYNGVMAVFDNADVLIMAAAVADYRPETKAEHKLKKGKDDIKSIVLTPTKDILAACGAQKKNQLIIGFALETDDELANAKQKLKNKNADMLVLNSLKDAGAGFGVDTNLVTFVFENEVVRGELKSKHDVALDILNQIERKFNV